MFDTNHKYGSDSPTPPGTGSSAGHSESDGRVQWGDGHPGGHLFPAPGPRQHEVYHPEHPTVLSEQPHQHRQGRDGQLRLLRCS